MFQSHNTNRSRAVCLITSTAQIFQQISQCIKLELRKFTYELNEVIQLIHRNILKLNLQYIQRSLTYADNLS